MTNEATPTVLALLDQDFSSAGLRYATISSIATRRAAATGSAAAALTAGPQVIGGDRDEAALPAATLRAVHFARHGPAVRQRHEVPGNAAALRKAPGLTPQVPPMDLPFPQGSRRGEASRIEPGAATGFAEPARDPGPEAPAAAGANVAGRERAAAVEALVGMPLAEVERLIIEATIRACGDSLPQAARVLGVSPSTLYRKRASWAGRSDGA